MKLLSNAKRRHTRRVNKLKETAVAVVVVIVLVMVLVDCAGS